MSTSRSKVSTIFRLFLFSIFFFLNSPIISTLEDIVMIFISIILFRIFGFIMCSEKANFRLPTEIVPVNYVLHFHPDFSTELFNGEVSISIDVLDDRDFIALHAKDLSISSARLSRLEKNEDKIITTGNVIIKKIFAINQFDILIIETEKLLSNGSYDLRFKFNGAMSKKNRGFFFTSHFDFETGSIWKTASTRFEPTYARQVFPCFDEPNFKTAFDISLVQPSGYHALSNMPIQRIEPSNPMPGFTTVYFQSSPPIPTYLVAFSMTDLVNRTAVIAQRWNKPDLVPFSAWSTLEKTISVDLVLHMVYRSMDLYMRLFKINYPLPKIDLIAIPGYSMDPTENWGLITYDETSMLYYGRSNSIKELKLATNHITYGIVQMWLGNLVTISWWNDFWLVKSFATYMQYYTTNWAFPDWKEIDTFHMDVKFGAMHRDSLVSSMPISRSIETPHDIHKIVQSVFKKKGASILLMLHHLMGERNFFLGIAHYLQAYSYKNANANDFVDSLQKNYQGNENLTRFVDTWTRQSGFPLLNIERVNDVYYINQTRFLCNNVTFYDTSDSPYSYRWDLPIYYTTNSSNGTKRIFLPYTARRISLLVNEEIVWVKFNTNSIGYYSVNYDVETWNTFVNVMRTRPNELRILDRVDLLNDAFANADSGRIPYYVPMGMLESLRNEKHYTMWTLAFKKITKIHGILRDTEIIEKFEALVRDLMISIYELIGWKSHPLHSFSRRRFRAAMLKVACTVGMKNCIDEVTERFRYWIENPNVRPHPDIKEIIYYYGMLNAGGEDDWKVVYNLFVVEPDIQERRRLMICLTAIRNPSILINYFEIAKDNNVMNDEEYLMIIRAAASNPSSSSVVWNFYTANWNFLISRYDHVDYEFARLIIPITRNFRDYHTLYEIRKFFEENGHGSSSFEARREALEIMHNNIAWMDQNYLQLKHWLDYFYG